MKLVSMKREKKKREEEAKTAPSEYYEPYAYGLRITLEKEELDKLELDVSDFKVGDKSKILGNIEVISLRESVSEKNTNKSVELQITDMLIDKSSKKPPSKYKGFKAIHDAGPGGKITE